MSTATTSPRTTAMIMAALAIAVTALIMAAIALHGVAPSASAGPAPEGALCAPIGIAPDDPDTRADSVAEAVASARLAAPGRAVEVLDFTRRGEATVLVQTSEVSGRSYTPGGAVRLLVPASASALSLSQHLAKHLAACDEEESE